MPPRTTKQKRGAIQKDGCVFIGAWVPEEIVSILDREVQRQDSDRSKVIRRALRQMLSRPA